MLSSKSFYIQGSKLYCWADDKFATIKVQLSKRLYQWVIRPIPPGQIDLHSAVCQLLTQINIATAMVRRQAYNKLFWATRNWMY